MLFNDRKRFFSFTVDYILTLLLILRVCWFSFDPGAMKNLKEEKSGGRRWEEVERLLLAH